MYIITICAPLGGGGGGGGAWELEGRYRPEGCKKRMKKREKERRKGKKNRKERGGKEGREIYVTIFISLTQF